MEEGQGNAKVDSSGNLMKIKKVDHIGIAVKDLEGAKGFYTKALFL